MRIYMPAFKDIVGHEQIIEHLQNAITMDKVSHAYILNGPDKSGKMMIAEAFAQTLQCEAVNKKLEELAGETESERIENKFTAEPCMECHSCKQAAGKNQPDIIYVSHEKPNTISVDDIRAQINNDIAIKPYSSPYKIYIMNEAEKMTPQAQNAILKTLEEPPEYAVIMLLTSNVNGLLPTILSRCVVLNMKPVADDLVRNFLMQQLQVPDYKAEVCVAFARGNIGKAKSLASSEDFDNIKNEALSLLKYIQDMDLSEITAAIKKITEYKLQINDYLDLIAIWYRDVLLFKATSDVNHLVFREEISAIRRVAQRSSYEGIEEVIEALDKAKRRLDANVNFDLTMELLMLEIKENG